MRTFIFLCDMTTEQECLDRSLFGTNTGASVQHHYSNVAVGDRLFLYNFETGSMRGPFAALTRCTHNLEPSAWKKTRRSFPWQVRVDDGGANRHPVGADEFARFIPLAQTKMGLLPPAELNDEQAEKLMALFL